MLAPPEEKNRCSRRTNGTQPCGGARRPWVARTRPVGRSRQGQGHDGSGQQVHQGGDCPSVVPMPDLLRRTPSTACGLPLMAAVTMTKASHAISLIVSRVGIFENGSKVCPFDEHSPSNSTGGAFRRSVPSRPVQHAHVVSPVSLRKSSNKSTRCERAVLVSPISPLL